MFPFRCFTWLGCLQTRLSWINTRWQDKPFLYFCMQESSQWVFQGNDKRPENLAATPTQTQNLCLCLRQEQHSHNVDDCKMLVEVHQKSSEAVKSRQGSCRGVPCSFGISNFRCSPEHCSNMFQQCLGPVSICLNGIEWEYGWIMDGYFLSMHICISYFHIV